MSICVHVSIFPLRTCFIFLLNLLQFFPLCEDANIYWAAVMIRRTAANPHFIVARPGYFR